MSDGDHDAPRTEPTSANVLWIAPVSAPIVGEPRLPGSKSLTNRALILGALADGESVISGALISDDTRYMAQALRALGIEVDVDEAGCAMRVAGCAGNIPASEADLYVGNAGTAARFLTPVLSLGHGRYRLDGNARMRRRPIEPLLAALRSLGVRVRSEHGTGCPPIVMDSDGLEGGRIVIDASISSQYLTALLLAAPSARSGTGIEVAGDAVSEPYLGMTVRMMRDWGLEVTRERPPSHASDPADLFESHFTTGRLAVPAPQTRPGQQYRVEPDASAASYFMACAAITGGQVRVDGLGRSSLQGDVRFADILAEMGCRVEWTRDTVTVASSGRLRGVDADMNAISDTAMTLAAIAPFAETPTRIRNVAHIRVKECDRISATAAELRRLGVAVVEHSDGLTVMPSRPLGGIVETYDDHRMAMSFALIGLRVAGIGIRNPECVAKTFPGYFGELARITGT